MTEELVAIADFIKESKTIETDIPALEETLALAITHAQRIGEILNQMEHDYTMFYADCLDRLGSREEETETTRKAKLQAMTADKKLLLDNLKTLRTSLKAIQMSRLQAIRTRREEPRNFGRP